MKITMFVIGALCATALHGQDTTYVPATDFASGRQVIAVYIGAKWCTPCMQPPMKDAIRRMKPLVRDQALKSGASFSAVLVALDRELASALIFAEPLGAFDEYAFGNDMAGLAAERFIWGEADPQPMVPQVIVGERTIEVQRGRPIIFGSFRVTRRVSGDSIPIWVASGAPLR
jgi:hypothetical protein